MKIMNPAGAQPAAWGSRGGGDNTTAVRAGETTLSQVASRLGVPVDDLRKANPQISIPDGLTAGMEINVPLPAGGTAAAPQPEAGPDAGAAPPASARMERALDAALMRAMLSSPAGGSPDTMAAHSGAGGSGGITQQPPVADPLAEREAPELKQQTLDALRTVYQSEEFKHLDAAARNSVLQTLASNPPLTADKVAKTLNLLGAARQLSEADRKLAVAGFRASHADPAYAANLAHLIQHPAFKNLAAAEKTAVLSQARNYPDSRSVANIERLVQKDWFKTQDLGDKQRSLKLVARLSQHPPKGDARIIGNTLERLVGAGSDFKVTWKTYPPGDETYFGEARLRDKTLLLNKGLTAADNGKMAENGNTNRLALNTVAHEVNHLINGDRVADTFGYFEAEYRAWYAGFQSEHGRVPTNQEAMDQRIRWQFDPDSFYGKHAAEAMKDPAEARKFYDFLGRVTGNKVDAGNWRTVLDSDPVSWPNLSESPAPRPSGNVDNH